MHHQAERQGNGAEGLSTASLSSSYSGQLTAPCEALPLWVLNSFDVMVVFENLMMMMMNIPRKTGQGHCTRMHTHTCWLNDQTLSTTLAKGPMG